MHVRDHSPQRVLELPRTRPENGHAGFPSAAPYERRAASAAILAAAALAIAAAVAARLSLAADNAAASAVRHREWRAERIVPSRCGQGLGDGERKQRRGRWENITRRSRQRPRRCAWSAHRGRAAR